MHLSLDDQSVVDSEALQHLVQLHELFPTPVMLLLAEPMERIWKEQHARMGVSAI